MKKNNCFGDFIYIVHASVFETFTTRWDCTGLYQGGGCSAKMQKWYDDANITLRFQDNKKKFSKDSDVT